MVIVFLRHQARSHEKQTGPSYFGGHIVDHRVLPDSGPNGGKVVFVFDRLEAATAYVRRKKAGEWNRKL